MLLRGEPAAPGVVHDLGGVFKGAQRRQHLNFLPVESNSHGVLRLVPI